MTRQSSKRWPLREPRARFCSSQTRRGPADTNIIICGAPALTVREDRERRRSTPAVHQGRTGQPGDSPAPRGNSGPHRAALRREHVRRFFRGPRHAATRLQPRRRERQSCPPDGGHDARPRRCLRAGEIVQRFGVQKGESVLVTLHRRASVDDRGTLEGIVNALIKSGRTVVFPIHPRTRKNLESFGLWEPLRATVKAIEPVDYLDFIALLMGASKVVTDSGGVQKEAYFFGVPCITLRDETEWIETVEDGWNALVGTDTADSLDAIEKFNPSGTKSKSFGGGHGAEKIALILDKVVCPGASVKPVPEMRGPCSRAPLRRSRSSSLRRP